MKRTAAALFVLAVAAPPADAGGGCRREGAVPQRRTAVIETEFACWAPAAALVAPGTTVTFRNPDTANDHNLSGPAIDFDLLPSGESRQVTFDKPGLYPFMCTLHPGMAGVVVVGGVPAVPPAAAADTGVAGVAGAAAGQPAPGGTGPSSDGGGSLVPWAVGAAFVAVVGAGAFAWRARGVPVPAR